MAKSMRNCGDNSVVKWLGVSADTAGDERCRQICSFKRHGTYDCAGLQNGTRFQGKGTFGIEDRHGYGQDVAAKHRNDEWETISTLGSN